MHKGHSKYTQMSLHEVSVVMFKLLGTLSSLTQSSHLKILHRELAARKILVGYNKLCKITQEIMFMRGCEDPQVFWLSVVMVLVWFGLHIDIIIIVSFLVFLFSSFLFNFVFNKSFPSK